MKIAVDAMGGDFAPRAIVEGAALSAESLGARVCLVGDEQALRAALGGKRRLDSRLEIVPATQVVGMHESPTKALREKPDSSMAVAVELVRKGEAEAVVSAGNTGAFIALATTKLKTIEGVERAAIATVLPRRTGKTVLLDSGANAECRPQMLVQFAIMGCIYARKLLGTKDPRVGLLNIGEEPGKGSECVRLAHELLAKAPVNFVGNVEADMLFGGEADVVVCEGFAGNIALKTAEGLADLLLASIRREFSRDLTSRLGALLTRTALARVCRDMDYAEIGGALLVGINGVCIKSHGRADAKAISNAIAVAQHGVNVDLLSEIREACRSQVAWEAQTA